MNSAVYAEEESTKKVVQEKKERVFNYNRRARIRNVDMGVDAPRDRYKVDRPSMDRLAEDKTESSIFNSEKEFIMPKQLPQPTPSRKKDAEEEDKKNWLTPAQWSDDKSEEGRNRTIFEQEYDDRKKAEEKEGGLWESEEEMSDSEREEERYREEDEEDEEDRYSLRKKTDEAGEDSDKRLGLLKFEPVLDRNLYSDEAGAEDRYDSQSAEKDAASYAVEERLSKLAGRREKNSEGAEDGGFNRTSEAMGLGSSASLDSNRSAKMMTDITDKWLGAGSSPSASVPKMEEMLKFSKAGGMNGAVAQQATMPKLEQVGGAGYSQQPRLSQGGMNLPSARVSPAGFKSPAFNTPTATPSLSRSPAGSFTSTAPGGPKRTSGYSPSAMPSMKQGYQKLGSGGASTSFSSPYSGGGTSGSAAPRRMKSEMGLGGFKVPKL